MEQAAGGGDRPHSGEGSKARHSHFALARPSDAAELIKAYPSTGGGRGLPDPSLAANQELPF